MLAVITGASSGLGAAFARKLAARGYDLLLIARREDRLQSIAREIGEQYHVRAEILVADLTDDAALAVAAARIREAPDLGLLVNNAGFGTLGYFFDDRPPGSGANAPLARARDHAAIACRPGESGPAGHGGNRNHQRFFGGGFWRIASECQLLRHQDLDEPLHRGPGH